MMNWPARMRIAAVTACRHTGSLDRATKRRRTAPRSPSPGPMRSRRNSRPVSISAQVEALTNSDPECPRCRSQSAAAILSRISLSTVSASGMRNSASARHIRATPSCEDRAYSCRKASSPAADPLPAHCGDEPARGYAYAVARLGRQFGGGDDACVGLGFVEAVPVADCRPQRRLDRRRFAEDPVHRRRTGPDAAGCQAANAHRRCIETTVPRTVSCHVVHLMR